VGADGGEQLGMAGEVAVGSVGGDAGAACGLAQDDGCGAAGAGELNAGGEQGAVEVAVAEGGSCWGGLRGLYGLWHLWLWTVYR